MTKDTALPATVIALLLGAAVTEAGVLTPVWSRPLDAPPRAVAVKPGELGDRLFLLLADGRVGAVSSAETLRIIGTAPAGATALAAAGPRLFFATGGRVTVTDFDCRAIRRTRQFIPSRVDSMTAAGEDENGDVRLCAWADSSVWMVSIGPQRAAAWRLGPDFVVHRSLLADCNGDGRPELVAAGPAGLLVAEFGPGRELTVRGPEPGALACSPVAAGDQADLFCLGSPAGAAGVYESLYCYSAVSARVRWCIGVRVDGARAGGSALLCASSTLYLAGVTGRGRGFVAAYDSLGLQTAARRFAANRGRPVALARLGGWPAIRWRDSSGVGTFQTLPPGLGGMQDDTPGYNGVAILRFIPMRLDLDTFPELVVIRAAADAPVRVDAFRNDLGRIAAAVEHEQNLVRSAVIRNDEAALVRSLRRLHQLSAELGPGARGRSTDPMLARRLRDLARRRTANLVAAALAIVAAATAALLLLGRRARRQRRDQCRLVERMPLSGRVALAVDLVAMDHNFVTKGNWPAAAERLRDIRDRAGLNRDVDLSRVSDQAEPHYSRVVGRLIDDSPTDPVLEFILTALRRARPDATVEFRPVSRGLVRDELSTPGFRVLGIENREYPDIYARVRWFSSPKLRSVIEHLIVDHARYARARAVVLLDYTVSTQWNRRLDVSLYSDSVESIDLGRTGGHLVSELRELSISLGPVVEIPPAGWRPHTPDEKLWLRTADLISVLEETRVRLTGPAR